LEALDGLPFLILGGLTAFQTFFASAAEMAARHRGGKEAKRIKKRTILFRAHGQESEPALLETLTLFHLFFLGGEMFSGLSTMFHLATKRMCMIFLSMSMVSLVAQVSIPSLALPKKMEVLWNSSLVPQVRLHF